MRIKEFNYQKKDGTVKLYTVLALEETAKDIFAIDLKDITIEEMAELERHITAIKTFADKYKKTNFRKFLKESVVVGGKEQ